MFSLKWTFFYFSAPKDLICWIPGLKDSDRLVFPFPSSHSCDSLRMPEEEQASVEDQVLVLHFIKTDNNVIVLQELFERVAIDAYTEEFEKAFFS